MNKQVKNILTILAGNALMAFAVAAFISPTGILCGGVTGISLIMRHVANISLSVTSGVVNVAAFVLGFFVFGKEFAMKTAISTVAFPVLLGLMDVPALQHLTSDVFLSSVMAGALAGAGVGLIIRAGGSSGGTDIPLLVLQKYTNLPFGIGMLAFNTIVLVFQITFSGSEAILYGIVNTVVMSFVMDYVMANGQSNVQVMAITPKYEEVADTLIAHNYGVTMVLIETGKTHEQQKAVMAATSARNLTNMKEMILKVDPSAFILSSEGAQISGRGFTYDRYDPVPEVTK